jgi:hypothetical protein
MTAAEAMDAPLSRVLQLAHALAEYNGSAMRFVSREVSPAIASLDAVAGQPLDIDRL